MPCFKLITNLPKHKIPNDFATKLNSILARSVGKEEWKFRIVVTADSLVAFGGDSSAPAAIATLESIGHIGKKQNGMVMEAVTEFLEKELNIDKERFFMTFYDLHKDNVGSNGTTVENP